MNNIKTSKCIIDLDQYIVVLKNRYLRVIKCENILFGRIKAHT